MLSPFGFAVVMAIVTELARGGVSRELLYAGKFFFTGERLKSLGMSSVDVVTRCATVCATRCATVSLIDYTF